MPFQSQSQTRINLKVKDSYNSYEDLPGVWSFWIRINFPDSSIIIDYVLNSLTIFASDTSTIVDSYDEYVFKNTHFFKITGYYGEDEDNDGDKYMTFRAKQYDGKYCKITFCKSEDPEKRYVLIKNAKFAYLYYVDYLDY